MKGKSKAFFAMLLVLLLSFSPVSAFAGEIENPTPVYITSGLDLEAEETESTFVCERMVYGEAEPDTWISVTLATKNFEGDLVERYQEDVEVGALGLFSFNLPFEMGTNYITLSAEKEGYDSTYYDIRVKRLSQRVKKELQSMVALPGFVKAN